MNRPEHDNTEFFIGTEVEHTPAYQKKTLFVVGIRPIEEIAKVLSDSFSSIGGSIEHIYFGANMSFPRLAADDAAEWNQWERMVTHFLKQGYWCTLDIDVQCIPGLGDTGLCEHHNFIPMISVKMPYVQQLGYNATVKIDDRDFKATNPGVWCHSLHSLTRRSAFTPWSDYSKDLPV